MQFHFQGQMPKVSGRRWRQVAGEDPVFYVGVHPSTVWPPLDQRAQHQDPDTYGHQIY